MKTAFLKKSYDEVMAMPRTPHKKPKKPNIFFRTLIRILSAKDLIPIKFSFVKKDMEKAGFRNKRQMNEKFDNIL